MTSNSARDAEREADRLRTMLTATLDQIVDNLAPANLATEALAVARAKTPVWMRRGGAFVRSRGGLALLGAVAAAFAATYASRARRRRS